MTHHEPNFAFPCRPVKILRTGVPSSLISYIGAVLLLCLAVLFVYAEGPGVWQDWQIRKDPVVVEDASMRDAVCRVRYVLLHSCSAHVDYAVAGHRYQQSLGFSFVTFHAGDWDVDVVRSRSHPEMVTFDLGLDMIWNRIAVLIALPLLVLYAGFMAMRAGGNRRATKSLEGQSFVLAPLKVEVETEDKKGGEKCVSFSCDIDGAERDFISVFRKDEAPFYLDDDKAVHALALRPPSGQPPILLDAALLRVELTAAERDALLASRRG